MTKSAEIAAKRAEFDKVEHVVDTFGRDIGVKRLRPSQQLKIEELAGALTGTTTIMDDNSGKTFEVPRRMPLILASSVASVDGNPVPFPKSRVEIDSVLDMLMDEGLTAVMEGLGKLNAPAAPAANGETATAADEVKN